jgi:SAM-dependent methyltransferase
MNTATTPNVTGTEYVRAMAAREPDLLARTAFQELLLRIAPAHAMLFDFGAGPGIDARFYVEHGFEVAAYDIDPEMCEYFSSHCRDLIEAGRVRLEQGSYQEFLARGALDGCRRADIVTSNFAPLSLVGDLKALFAKFHALTGPDGKVLASVLNPYCRGDLKYGWWWRNALRLWRNGHYSIPGAQAPIVRRRLAEFSSQCAPYFKLQRVYRGLPPRNVDETNGIDMNRSGRYPWLHVNSSQFLFLLFSKDAGAIG